ncbi:MAG: hypothetical protein DRM99_00945 [Thermoplasmata archaeon]|nr:MAG: hypothetical protein DRM99_00945 [Thermoplasmata archaeon]RLF53712.1 MAG: hypothetical protein DRN24_00070 [Thermoplasmata archaeon]
MREELTFEDGVLLCKHIYQTVVEKTLNGVIEQDQIFITAHEMLSKILDDFKNERVDELLHIFNMEDIYTII